MVEIESERLSGISEYVEKALSYMGKVMHCLGELEEHSSLNERRGRSYRDYDESEEREYRGYGRYSRY